MFVLRQRWLKLSSVQSMLADHDALRKCCSFCRNSACNSSLKMWCNPSLLKTLENYFFRFTIRNDFDNRWGFFQGNDGENVRSVKRCAFTIVACAYRTCLDYCQLSENHHAYTVSRDFVGTQCQIRTAIVSRQLMWYRLRTVTNGHL